MQFKLKGTSLSGESIEVFATTNSKGVATFTDILISGNVKYTLSEVNTAERYEVPASQSVAVEWNKTTQVSVYNKLKRGDLQITKTSEDGMVEGIKFRLKIASFKLWLMNSLTSSTTLLYCSKVNTGIVTLYDSSCFKTYPFFIISATASKSYSLKFSQLWRATSHSNPV